MPTINKQKQVRVEKIVVLVFIWIVGIIILAALRELAERKLALLQFTDSSILPYAIGSVNPVYYGICLVMGYFAGKAVANIWFAPYTTPEKEEANAKN